MRLTAYTLFIFSTIVAASSSANDRSLLFIIGLVRTMDDRGSTSAEVEVKSERIVQIGERAEVERAIARPTRIIDMQGGVLFPGFTNAHCSPEHIGNLNIQLPVLKAYVKELHKKRFQVHFHAIGDRTTRAALNAIEHAASQPHRKGKDRRHTVSHLQFVHPADAIRFETLGVYANIQALWAFPYDHSMDPFLDKKIGKRLYPFRTLRDAGAVIVSGSDWPVSTANPFHAIVVAVLRKDQSNSSGRALLPEQSLEVDDMMRALTVNGAKLMHQEDIRGTIEVGKLAELVLLDKDPYSVDPHDLSEIRVNLTVFDGRVVYQRADS